MFKLENDRGFLYQWDTHQRLKVNDPHITEAHFSNGTSSNAVVCEIYEEDGQRFANIPDILLQRACPINVYAFLPNYTKACYTFGVSGRPKPEDYVYTEEEQKVWEDLEDRVKMLEEGDLAYTLTDTDKAAIVAEVLANFTDASEVAL
ncbi:MAG: hypothetical protein IJB76_06540 [Clostridia bacterium]|nr:hypothetical protein [Clostridia bacterium]